MKHIIIVNGEEAKWKYIEDLYDIESKRNLRMAPKLSVAHIYPTNFQKMKVKYAAQVLSSSVAAGTSFILVRSLLENYFAKYLNVYFY